MVGLTEEVKVLPTCRRIIEVLPTPGGGGGGGERDKK